MKAKVDPDLCISCGLCTEICSDVFEMGDDGFAHAVKEVTEDLEESATEARDECPTEAISISE